MTRPRYRHGPRVRQTPHLRSVRERACWAARMVGVKASLLRRVRWMWFESIDYGGQRCYGLCSWRDGKTWISVSLAGGIVDTVLHELAHAVLGPVQGDYDARGTRVPEHDPIWKAMYRQIRRHYRGRGGPPVEE